jgi:hypothetical protein
MSDAAIDGGTANEAAVAVRAQIARQVEQLLG